MFQLTLQPKHTNVELHHYNKNNQLQQDCYKPCINYTSQLNPTKNTQETINKTINKFVFFLECCSFFFNFSFFFIPISFNITVNSFITTSQLQSHGSLFMDEVDDSAAITGRTYGGCPSISSSHMYNLQLLAV